MALSYPLPIDKYIPEIIDTIRESPAVIIKAEPGAGKTTRLPMALLDLGNTIVLEPRRLAAKLSSEHVAEQLRVPCGEEVGYQVRFDHRVSKNTKLRYMTEGLFLRLLENNPKLDGIQHVILDEFHERHIDTDIAMAMLKKLQATSRPDLKIVVMSATVDLESLESYLDNSRSFVVPGKVFPVEIQYHDLSKMKYTEEKVLWATQAMLNDRRFSGDILIFLTGYQEINKCKINLEKHLDQSLYSILPLYADLPPAKQKIVFQNSRKRKIILSTNVAETSVTIGGITGVIDLGQAKVSGFAPWSGLPTLQVKAISQASCIQRAGRAGRLQEGICYRLFSENDFLKRDKFTAKEILHSDLTSMCLMIKERYPEFDDVVDAIPWLTPPPEKHLKASLDLLKILGAIDDDHRITDEGRQMLKVPAHPRLAAMVLEGKKQNAIEQGILSAALISEDMIINFKENAFETGPCDVCFQGNLMRNLERGEDLASRRLENSIDSRKRFRVKQMYQSLSKAFKGESLKTMPSMSHKVVSQIILKGFLDRVAKFRPAAKNKRQPDQRSFHFCLGRGGILSSYSVVRKSEYLIVLDAFEVPGKQNSAIRTQIRYASAVSKESLQKQIPMLSSQLEIVFDKKSEKTEAIKKQLYGQFTLTESKDNIEAHQIESFLSEKIKSDWPYPFESDDDLRSYHKKLDLLESHDISHNFPRFEDDYLDFLIQHICEGKTDISKIREKPLRSYIEEQLSYEELYRLNLLCPPEIKIGKRARRISYLGEHAPSVESAIQDFFGLSESPKICEDKQALNLIMLAPNRRPAQITQDLQRFWKGSYFELKKELGRRYPKHRWPDDPENDR